MRPDAVPMESPEWLRPYARGIALPRAGLRLFYYDTADGDEDGSRPVLLLVHGLGDEADTWRAVIPALSRRYRVLAPDLPGFGRSSLPRRPRLGPPFLRDTLLELLDALGVERATLVGNSLGASLVQLVAMARSRLVERLVLVDGAVAVRLRFRSSMLLSLLPGVGELRYRGLSRNLPAAYASLRPYYASLDGLPPSEREFLRRRVAERVQSGKQQRAYLSVYRGMARWTVAQGRAIIQPSLAIAAPTLYIWGAEDRIIPLTVGRQVCSLQAGARLEVIPAAGHLPHQEDPQAFLRAVEGDPAPSRG